MRSESVGGCAAGVGRRSRRLRRIVYQSGHRQRDPRQCAALGRGAQALADPARSARQRSSRRCSSRSARACRGKAMERAFKRRRLLVADRRAFRHVTADRLRDGEARQEETRPEVIILPSIAATYPPHRPRSSSPRHPRSSRTQRQVCAACASSGCLHDASRSDGRPAPASRHATHTGGVMRLAT